MLILWPQAVTPGLTHFGAHHRPPDSHFCRSHCHKRRPLFWALWLSSVLNHKWGTILISSRLSGPPQLEMRNNLILMINFSCHRGLPSQKWGRVMRDDNRLPNDGRPFYQSIILMTLLLLFSWWVKDVLLTNICFRYMSRLRTRVDSVGDSGIEMSPRESTY